MHLCSHRICCGNAGPSTCHDLVAGNPPFVVAASQLLHVFAEEAVAVVVSREVRPAFALPVPHDVACKGKATREGKTRAVF